VIIKDCAKIADNTILHPNAVIPAQTLYAGSPGKFLRLFFSTGVCQLLLQANISKICQSLYRTLWKTTLRTIILNFSLSLANFQINFYMLFLQTRDLTRILMLQPLNPVQGIVIYRFTAPKSSLLYIDFLLR
jgi:hypothetical protein